MERPYTRRGVAGMSLWRAPVRRLRASTMALMTADGAMTAVQAAVADLTDAHDSKRSRGNFSKIHARKSKACISTNAHEAGLGIGWLTVANGNK